MQDAKAIIKRTSAAAIFAAIAVTAIAAPVSAGKPGGATATTNSLSVVLVSTNDATINHGDQVTFKVTTTYTYPVVSATCTQNGVVVYGDSHPMYTPNAFNDPGIFVLSSTAWPSGGASCTAALKVQKKTGVTTVATTSFSVAP